MLRLEPVEDRCETAECLARATFNVVDAAGVVRGRHCTKHAPGELRRLYKQDRAVKEGA